MLKWLFNLWGRKGTDFTPGTETFPAVNVDVLAAGLGLEKRGTADGRSNIPPPDAETLTGVEQALIDRVRAVRKRGLDHYENQISVYESRIRGARADREKIDLEAGAVRNAMVVACDKWRNHLTNERRSVSEFQDKLNAYRMKNAITGPPRRRKNGVLMFGVLLLVLLIEVALSGVLFSQKNVMGLAGGMGIALVISVVNIMFCLLLGVASRYVNLRLFGAKLFGSGAVLLFLVFAFSLNLTVSHFRDALETFPWDQAAFAAIVNLKANPLGIESFNSWIIFLFGVIVSIVAYLEGLLWIDRYPGHNQIYEDTQEAITAYSDSYEEAQADLETIFENSRDTLKADAQIFRARIGSALDAVGSQSTLTRQLTTFLTSCDSAANQLLRRYREANMKSRALPRPPYFENLFAFESYIRPQDLDTLQKDEAQQEIARIDEIVEKGVADILATRQQAITAFPTIADLLEAIRVPTVAPAGPRSPDFTASTNPEQESR